MLRKFAICLLALLVASAAAAQDSARTKQLRLLCVQLSGDLTEPGGIAAFRRCLARDPVSAMKQNAFPGGGGIVLLPPAGYGRNTRRAIAGAVTKFQVVNGNVVYALITDGKLWRDTIGAKDAHVIDPSVKSFQVVDGAVYALGPDAKLWREDTDGKSRQWVDSAVASFQALDRNVVYVLGTDSKLWRETGDMKNRTSVDFPIASFEAVAGNLVYAATPDGTLWAENGGRAHRTRIASKLGSFRVAGDSIYVLTSPDAVLWRMTAGKTPEQVDSDVGAFAAMDGNVAYVLTKDGRLWREPADTRHKELIDEDVQHDGGAAAIQIEDNRNLFVLDRGHALWRETMPAER